jgi:invasion protein IalB
MVFTVRATILLCAVTAINLVLVPKASYAQEVDITPSSWSSSCLSTQVCELKTEIVRNNSVVARVSIFRMRGYFWLQYTVPPGIDLIHGISIAVDGDESTNTLISNCTNIGCTGHLDLTPRLISSMKSGSNLQLIFINPSNHDPLMIPFSLSGFTSGFDELIQ